MTQFDLFDEGDDSSGDPVPFPDTPEAMLALLAGWQSAGLLRGVDVALARLLAAHAAQASDVMQADRRRQPPATDARDQARSLSCLMLGAALCSWQLGRGHACLDLMALQASPEPVLGMPVPAADDAGRIRPSSVPLSGVGTAGAEPDGGTGAETSMPAPARLLAQCSPDDWVRAARCLPAVVELRQRGIEAVQPDAPAPVVTPLVLSGTRLYLRRYWQYEQDVLAAILSRLDGLDIGAVQAAGANPEASLKPVLDALFMPPAGGQAAATTGATAVDWQKVACALVARQRFGLITGGPGTGKTTTVIRLLALLQSLSRQRGEARFLRIGLAAPTGKAAARLGSSIQGAIDRLTLDGLADAEAIRAAIPTSVSTLHRLLGSRPDSRHFRHGENNPLPLDVLVVDEASMVDLEMMAFVVKALPPQARLILLGDKDQLASVEAGAILGELCARAQDGHYWPQTADWVRRETGQSLPDSFQDEGGWPLDQSIAMLRHSHRFSSQSGIGALAEAVNQGDGGRVRRLWREAEASGAESDICRIVVMDRERHALRSLVVSGRASGHDDRTSDPGGAPAQGTARLPNVSPGDSPEAQGYAHYLRVMHRHRPQTGDTAGQGPIGQEWDAWANQVLGAHTRFQLLCALRQGTWGVEALNQQIAQWLQQDGLLPASEGWYEGRPVMVTRNDYELGLMNGDIGICLQTPKGLRVAFAGAGEGELIRWVLPSRLQSVDTVFAMTVHKAQGSEFDHAALAMPDTLSPVLTRELVYTAITRARAFFTLCGPEGVDWRFEETIHRRVMRASGLMAEMVQPPSAGAG
ncbi:MAG: exodeoxyribonuclease V subunit alpha [Lautropia sp.]|nr:exodeoxyribonuclease V subunit alpha [Lautropia sp.]